MACVCVSVLVAWVKVRLGVGVGREREEMEDRAEGRKGRAVREMESWVARERIASVRGEGEGDGMAWRDGGGG